MNETYNCQLKKDGLSKKKHVFIRASLRKILKPSLNVVMFSPADFENPYQSLIYSSLQSSYMANVTVDNILRYQRFGVSNILHIHWDEYFLSTNNAVRAKEQREILKTFLDEGGRIVWTVHNQQPHDTNHSKDAGVFLENRVFLCKVSEKIHVHNSHAKEYILSNFNVKEDKIIIIAHPSYLDWYSSISLDKKYSNKKSLLLFGKIRKYKGYNLIKNALENVESSGKIKQFHIAGNGAQALKEEEINGIQIKKTGGHILDEDLPNIFAETDFAIFGFSSILTSGSILLAISFGVPPIAPGHPGVIASIPEGLHDLLYLPNDTKDFSRVIDYALSLSEEEYLLKTRLCIEFAKENHASVISRNYEKELLI